MVALKMPANKYSMCSQRGGSGFKVLKGSIYLYDYAFVGTTMFLVVMVTLQRRRAVAKQPFVWFMELGGGGTSRYVY